MRYLILMLGLGFVVARCGDVQKPAENVDPSFAGGFTATHSIRHAPVAGQAAGDTGMENSESTPARASAETGRVSLSFLRHGE